MKLGLKFNSKLNLWVKRHKNCLKFQVLNQISDKRASLHTK